MRRSEFVASTAAAGLLAASPPPLKVEQPVLRVGTPVGGASQLPLYVAAARTMPAAGLTLNVTEFRGDSETSQALAGGSIDISLQSMNGLLNIVTAGQPILAFYAGFNCADFAWYTLPSNRSWADLRGKTIGVATYGSITDALTRYALRSHGLEPEKDVSIVQTGGSPAALQSMKAGRLEASILGAPFRYEAQDAGYRLLSTQSKDIAPFWPKHLYLAKTKFMADNPNTFAAFLRAHVAAIRMMKRDPNVAISLMTDRLKYTEAFSHRAFADEIASFDERGGLPEKSMPVFWKISVANGDVKAPLAESAFLDRRYIDSFKSWA